MYHPTSRVLTVLELLQSRSYISGPELAARLEVDVRTVRRYIIMLQDIGIPVEAVIGRHGGYKLRPGFKLPPLMFSNDEVLAITLGLQLVQRVGVDAMSPTVEGVMAKLERVLPTSLRQHVQAMQETLVMDTLLPDVLVERMVIETLSLAAQQCRQVRLSYRANDDRETERVIDPYGVVCHDGFWYTVGYCHLRSGLRVFRLDRIRQLKLQEELFIRPADFHCLEYIIQSFVAIPDKWNVEVVLMISLEEARRKVPASLASLTLEPQSQGVMLCTSIGDLNRMAQFLVGLGCTFVIHQPIELKTALLELAETMVHMAQ
jgi:predicted DNA-binding transcriptional regulator YafY